jgi:hypothetical protein
MAMVRFDYPELANCIAGVHQAGDELLTPSKSLQLLADAGILGKVLTSIRL